MPITALRGVLDPKQEEALLGTGYVETSPDTTSSMQQGQHTAVIKL